MSAGGARARRAVVRDLIDRYLAVVRPGASYMTFDEEDAVLEVKGRLLKLNMDTDSVKAGVVAFMGTAKDFDAQIKFEMDAAWPGGAVPAAALLH